MSTTTTTAAASGKPVRKFPPPCWTRDEALVLIEAYRERWYALHRAFLKNPDWDAVAEKVTTSCPDVTPPKTSAQCRHKMEKLRQRHRAEKQRAASFPGGRFFSSWFYFEAMEAMENGPNAEPNNNNNPKIPDIIDGIPLSDHRGLNPGRGIRFKPTTVNNLVTLATSSTNYSPNFNSRVSNHNWPNQEDEYLIDSIINETSIPIRIKPSIPPHQEPAAPRKFHYHDNDNDHEIDENGEMWIKVPRNNCNKPNLKQGKKRERGNGGIHEVVSSIKLLGEGFMKMEKMKIDMARDIERMRMETEMKRNQLILESQKQIVDAFVKGLVETRKRPRAETVADSLL